MNNVICSLPFSQIHNQPGLSYTPCCWSKKASEFDPSNTLPIDYFDSEEFRRLRKEMITGERTDFLNSYCSACYKLEEESKSSPRLLNPINEQLLKNFNSDGSLVKNQNRFISLAINIFGNYCNLECYACRTRNSSSRNSAIKKIDPKWTLIDDFKIITHSKSQSEKYTYVPDSDIKKISNDQFDQIKSHLVKYSSNILSIEIIGGEPFLMKSHFEILDSLIECGQSKHIELSYVSNMTIVDLDVMKYYIDHFKFTHIQWSVDALKERNYWLRYPTDWEKTTENVFNIQKYLKKTNSGIIFSTITPSLLSITTLKNTYGWLRVRNLISHNNNIVNTLTSPKILRTRNLPNEIKDEISHTIKSISQSHYNDLIQERNEEEFQLSIEYCDELDKSRGTDWRSTFPEIAKYAN
jgi:organic radical activating enzyme